MTSGKCLRRNGSVFDRSVGFAGSLHEKHDGEVPGTMPDSTKSPGSPCAVLIPDSTVEGSAIFFSTTGVYTDISLDGGGDPWAG